MITSHEPASARDFFDDPPVLQPSPSPEPASTETPHYTRPLMPPPSHRPVAYQPISQHDEAEGDGTPQRPNRRRKPSASGTPAVESLQLVETSAPAAPEPTDALPQRTKPRRRRSASEASGPLMLVETQGGAEAAPGDNPPAQ